MRDLLTFKFWAWALITYFYGSALVYILTGRWI